MTAATEKWGRKLIKAVVRYLLPTALTVLLVVALFRKVSFSDMMSLLRNDVDYWWILLAMGLSIVSHVLRAARWRIQLNALGIYPPFMALCCSIFGCYALNLVFPRLGEVWRCTYISTSQKSSFPTVLGSMIGDRVADTIMVFFLLLLCLIVGAPALEAFLAKYPVGRGVMDILESFWFWGVAGVLLIAVFGFRRWFMATSAGKKLCGIIKNIWEGFYVIIRMKGRGLFVLLTIAVWGCYYIQLYVAFYAFGFTRALCSSPGTAFGLIPCLVAFVLSSISMAVPSNGGLGPWNIAIIFGLSIYGITEPEGTAFSMLQWSGETVILILLGIFTMAYISLTHKGEETALKEAFEEEI